MTTTRETFEAAYVAAREDSRRAGASLAERDAAWREAAKVARRADRAGFPLDEVSLDEQARRNLYGGAK